MLLALALAASSAIMAAPQTLIGGLASDVASLGAELGLRVDFERRDERKAFAEALELLCRLGVLRQRDGSREAFVARDESDEEALFDIEHGRLGSLKATPVALTDVEGARSCSPRSTRPPRTASGRAGGTGLRVRWSRTRALPAAISRPTSTTPTAPSATGWSPSSRRSPA